MKIDTSQLMTVAELATELGISTQAIYKRIKAGKVETIKIGKVNFVKKNA